MSGHKDTAAARPRAETDARRDLLLLRAGARRFAVFADEADGVAQGSKHAPLPHAPRAVLGVASVRGRMYTVLDPNALVGAHEETEASDANEDATPHLLVVLRGDEQLALAADADEGLIEINADSIAPPDAPDAPLRGTLEHDGARVLVLDPSRLFEAALHGVERRRQRQK